MSSLFLEALDRDSLLCDPDSYPTPHSRQKKKGGGAVGCIIECGSALRCGGSFEKTKQGDGRSDLYTLTGK